MNSDLPYLSSNDGLSPHALHHVRALLLSREHIRQGEQPKSDPLTYTLIVWCYIEHSAAPFSHTDDSFQLHMLLQITQRAVVLVSLFRAIPKPTLLYALHFHTTENTPPNLCNSYTHLLQSHPQTPSIQQIHARILIEGSSLHSFSATHLVKSYAKAGNLHAAEMVFESVQNKSVFLWNAIIRAFSRNEMWVEVANLYRRMEEERIEPDNYTLPFVIKAFAALSYVEDGRRVHSVADRIGLVKNAFVATALIEMYVKFEDINLAFEVFDKMSDRDVVTWTTMISGYVEHGKYKEASLVFREMRLSDVKPNWVTILGLIPACDYSIHSLIIKLGFDSSAEVETATLDMYAKCGDLIAAYNFFKGMLKKNLVSYTVMVVGFSQNGHANEALWVFYEMIKTVDIKPDAVISASVLQACSQLGTLNRGEMMHGYFFQTGYVTDILVETALVDMYSKCGSLDAAQRIFDAIKDPNLIAWSALIGGYGDHGFGLKSLELFEQMKREGFMPDETALLSVLSACSHSGLVNEGKEYFKLMVDKFKLIPRTKHYGCMVDLLGRAGLVEEAWDFIEGMPIEPDVNVWGALLSACRVKGNDRVAEIACRKLFEMEPDNTDHHVLLANLYARCGRWNEVSNLRSAIRRKRDRKTPGCSSIEVNCKIHTFFAGDRSHPESENINYVLDMIHTRK